jgi:hypothetical protein
MHDYIKIKDGESEIESAINDLGKKVKNLNDF